jgi:glutathione-regulated potassium-efflux system ancillary protein KefF
MSRLLLIVAHPELEHSRVGAALVRAAQRLARDGLTLEIRDIYALYPDYLVDGAAEQAALERADLVVWLHPIHWYGMPPLMKLWLDEVFAFGWAYGPGGTRLAGRDLWLVTSTGGSEHSYRSDGYNRYFFDSFMPPYDQTAALAGMRFLPPFVLHGAHRVDQATIDAHAEVFAQRLRSYPDWPELEGLDACELRTVPADERPSGD